MLLLLGEHMYDKAKFQADLLQLLGYSAWAMSIY